MRCSEAATLGPLEFTLRCMRSTNHASGSIDILQIHTHAQLAHWAFVTHTTVVDHCRRTRLVNVLLASWIFKNDLFSRKEKIIYPFSTQSMSRLSPEYLTIDLIIAIF